MGKQKHSKVIKQEEKRKRIESIAKDLSELYNEEIAHEAAEKYAPMIYAEALSKYQLVPVPNNWKKKVFKFHADRISVEEPIDIFSKRKKVELNTQINFVYDGSETFFTSQVGNFELSWNVMNGLNNEDLKTIKENIKPKSNKSTSKNEKKLKQKYFFDLTFLQILSPNGR